MLNFEDLAQLKIDALLKKQDQHQISHYFIDYPLNFMYRSNQQIIIQHSSNGNILSFAYSLLANIFSPKSFLSKRNCNNCSNKESLISDRATGLSQNNISKQFGQSYGQSDQGREKLQRLLQLLYSKRVDLSQIINIPLNVEQALQLLSSQNYHKNMYLKKLFLQFLKILLEQHQLGPKLSQTNKNQNIVLSALQQFPLMESIIAIFCRCILLNDYQISQAKDYNKPISDQTAFTALCDTFSCHSLRIQQKYIELHHGNFIQFLKLKKKISRNEVINSKFYLLSLQNFKQQTLPHKQNGTGIKFRVRKKSTDVSNTQTISLRQICRVFSNQQSEQNKKINQKDKDSKVQTNTRLNCKADETLNLIDEQDKKNNILQKNTKFYPKSKTSLLKKESIKTNNDDKNKNIQKLAQKETLKTKQYNNFWQCTPELNGYTSFEILKQLNPQLRDSIIKKINHTTHYHS